MDFSWGKPMHLVVAMLLESAGTRLDTENIAMFN